MPIIIILILTTQNSQISGFSFFWSWFISSAKLFLRKRSVHILFLFPGIRQLCDLRRGDYRGCCVWRTVFFKTSKLPSDPLPHYTRCKLHIVEPSIYVVCQFLCFFFCQLNGEFWFTQIDLKGLWKFDLKFQIGLLWEWKKIHL